jgi:hypothetical protein
LNKVTPKLPDEVIERLRPLFDVIDAHQFAIGYYLVDVVDEFEHIMKRSEIIRQFAQAYKCDTSTLRERENVCRFVTPVMRDKYEIFNWSQWRSLKTAGSEWESYAGKAVDNLWSSEKIRYEIAHDKNGQPRWKYWWGKLTDAVDKLWGDADTPQEIRDLIEDLAGSKVEL